MAKKLHEKDAMCRFFSNFIFVEKFILLKIGSTMDAYHPKRRFTLSFAGWKVREYKYSTRRSCL